MSTTMSTATSTTHECFSEIYDKAILFYNWYHGVTSKHYPNIATIYYYFVTDHSNLLSATTNLSIYHLLIYSALSAFYYRISHHHHPNCFEYFRYHYEKESRHYRRGRDVSPVATSWFYFKRKDKRKEG